MDGRTRASMILERMIQMIQMPVEVKLGWFIKPYFSKLTEAELAQNFLDEFKAGFVHLMDDPDGDNLYTTTKLVSLEHIKEAVDYLEENESDFEGAQYLTKDGKILFTIQNSH
jgi:hypothetical protein